VCACVDRHRASTEKEQALEFHERMAIVHALHEYWNPVTGRQLAEVAWAMDLRPGQRVLDIACGAGGMLVRWAREYGISGVGVDVSPGALEQAERRRDRRAPDADLTFVEARGEDFQTDERFDVVACVGASWIWQGYRGTLKALIDFAKPGGLVLCGEPYWLREPDPAYLEAAGYDRETFFRLHELEAIGHELGLRQLYVIGATTEGWDRYETRQLLAADRWARANPDHPDVDEVLAATRRSATDYLRWGRDTFGWALLLFRVPG
jgi:SAM-dependent methyltransferase